VHSLVCNELSVSKMHGATIKEQSRFVNPVGVQQILDRLHCIYW